jgi:uncharacterized membrane protein
MHLQHAALEGGYTRNRRPAGSRTRDSLTPVKRRDRAGGFDQEDAQGTFRMTSTYPIGVRRWWKPLRIVRVRWRLFLAALIALLMFALLPSDWRPINRVLVGWDVGVVVYLMLMLELAMSTHANHIRSRCVLYDEGRVTIPVLTVTAALASIGAIFVQLGTAPAGHHFLNLVFAAVTILLSWTLIQVIFAFHYAHEYYAEHRRQARGLGFPGDDAPNYFDFFYFAFVIGMTSQVSDVTVKSKALRRMVTAHGLLSFVFNLTLLALAVNLAASSIGSLSGL